MQGEGVQDTCALGSLPSGSRLSLRFEQTARALKEGKRHSVSLLPPDSPAPVPHSTARPPSGMVRDGQSLQVRPGPHQIRGRRCPHENGKQDHPMSENRQIQAEWGSNPVPPFTCFEA